MLDISIVFVTVSLIILVFLAYKMDVPKAGIPMVSIYFIFIIFSLLNSENEEEKITVKEPNIKSTHNINRTGLNNSNPIKSNVRPKPLILPKSAPKNKSKKINKPSVKKPKKPPITKIEKPYVTTMTLRDIQICKDIKNRNPVGTDNYFRNNVDTLFCYTRIQNTGGKQELAHLWYYDDQLVTTVKYNIKTSNIYRSWTRKTIFSHQVGVWRVDVIDSANTIIGSKSFYITDEN
ncbi:MAG: hypothetical protein CMG74_07970 [Candidatus Marinimicrobia bacterium]|nr:hypothetical protein [Candidatus Neomarinimicrobiota bacterium]|tara:strand:+ start:735 stop:1436 length:702 start_codon:yes stop_codon:yes gene_type:complete